MLGALRFEPRVYAAVAERPGALYEAAAAVVLAGVARGVGAWPKEGWLGVVGGVVVGVLLWLVAALLIWAVTSVMIRRRPAFAPVLRTLGLAATPMLGLALSGLPLVGRAFWVVSHLMATAAAVLAVREGERVTTRQAASICVIAVFFGLVLSTALGADLPADSSTRP